MKTEVITKWCIRRSQENYEEINDWFNRNTENYFAAITDYVQPGPYNRYNGLWYYLHYPAITGKQYRYKCIRRGYTEITFDEFKRNLVNIKFIKSKSKLINTSIIRIKR